MSFYLTLLLVLVLQGSILVGIFGSYLFVPDLLLSLLFLSNVRGKTAYGRGFLGALLLDMLQGSLGWHASGKLLALFLLDLLKRRFYIESVPSMTIGYVAVATVEHAYRYAIFRVKYYYPMELYALSAGFFIEVLVIYYFGKKIIRKDDS